MVINIGLIEVVITILCFLGSMGVVVWRVSKMQTEQNAGIESNKKAIEDTNEKIGEVSEKVSTQASYNIKTEKRVSVLQERLSNMGDNISEIKDDIKTLLTMRRADQ